MIPFPAGHHVLARAHRRRRVQRCNINFRNLTKLTRIVTKMVITRGLELFTHTTIEATSDAIIIAQQDDSHSRSVDAAAIELIIPFTLILRRRLRREVRELEASLVRMKDQYQACSVKIYSRDQMGAMEYLHRIGWRGNMINPTANRDIAQRIDALLLS